MAKKKKIPHTYVIVFYIIILSAILTWIIPGGEYHEKISYEEGIEKKEMIFEYTESSPQTWEVFAALFKGFENQAGIIVFILMIGGAFWIMNDSKAIDVGIFAFLRKTRKLEKYKFIRYLGVNNIIIALVMLMFSIFGAVFGMSEETIAFIIILVPMAISMGYDSIVGVNMVFVAAGLGFAGAILNPFTIGIAQGLSDIPLFSGIEYRMFCWLILNSLGIFWVLRYARKIKKNPEKSLVYKEDEYWRKRSADSDEDIKYYTPKSAWFSYIFVLIIFIIISVYFPTTRIKIGNPDAVSLKVDNKLNGYQRHNTLSNILEEDTLVIEALINPKYIKQEQDTVNLGLLKANDSINVTIDSKIITDTIESQIVENKSVLNMVCNNINVNKKFLMNNLTQTDSMQINIIISAKNDIKNKAVIPLSDFSANENFEMKISSIHDGSGSASTLPVFPITAVLFALFGFITLRKSVHYYILNILAFTIIALIVGVMGYGWYVMEIATLFFAMGIIAGIAMNKSPNNITKLFLDGVKDILSAALVVGLAGGIIAVLEEGKIIDTILYGLSSGMKDFGKVASVSIMYAIQTVINIVIPSGSAKAALTMPIMAPFSDLIGVSRQATVMAFQFGDGFTNMITPTSGVLIGVLGVAKIPYEKWVKWITPFMIILVLLGLILLIPTVLMDLNGF